MAKKHNRWAGLTPRQKAERVASMIEARRRNAAFKIEQTVQTLLRRPHNGPAPGAVTVSMPLTPRATTSSRDLEALAELIVAVWRRLPPAD